jgi:hypothetical protein
MTRKSDTPKEKKEPLQVFTFPTVGNGVSVKARNREEAEKLVRDLQSSSPLVDGQ